ncbi:MAG: signal peptidase II [Sphingomicrobium sp.]
MAERKFGFAVAALVFILDQLTKWVVTGPLGINAIGDQLEIIPIFNLTYTENFGISLGLFQANSALGQWLLIAVTGAIAAGVAYWIGREKQRFDQVALGMVLGGALGNILDLARFGHVVDFADLHFGDFRPFLIFNVADAAISIAVVIMLLRAFLPGKDADEIRAKGQEPRETIDHA